MGDLSRTLDFLEGFFLFLLPQIGFVLSGASSNNQKRVLRPFKFLGKLKFVKKKKKKKIVAAGQILSPIGADIRSSLVII